MDLNKKARELPSKTSSLISVDGHLSSSKSDDTIENILKSNSSSDQLTSTKDHSNVMMTKRSCSLTQMLLIYAQQEINSTNSVNQNLKNVLNVLELHFNTYADEKREIYFEEIFRILLDFKEQITEAALIETMQLLQINPLDRCSFEDFILILCHLPAVKSDHHLFLDVFNELDYNKDSYITFEDIQMVLPHLTSHFDEEIIRAAMRVIDADHDDGRLSYMDFVTSLIALQECKSTMKTKTTVNEDSRVTNE